jgi:hypothetical protein
MDLKKIIFSLNNSSNLENSHIRRECTWHLGKTTRAASWKRIVSSSWWRGHLQGERGVENLAALKRKMQKNHKKTTNCIVWCFFDNDSVLVYWIYICSRTWRSGPPKWAKCVRTLSNAKRDGDLKAFPFLCTSMPNADTESCPNLVQDFKLANNNLGAHDRTRE